MSTELHAHACPDCGNQWAHQANPSWSDEEHTQAHRCPVCNGGPSYLKLPLARELQRLSRQHPKFMHRVHCACHCLYCGYAVWEWHSAVLGLSCLGLLGFGVVALIKGEIEI